MSGLILPSSYDRRTAIGRGEDVNDITRSVQEGDMTVGWRGDPQMDVYREGSFVKVYGFDAAGQRYVAATVNIVDSDWRTTLLRKLRDGDWQKDTLISRLVAEREQQERDRQRLEDDLTAEQADILTTAFYRAKGSRRHF
jgi:hypothetical protein